MTKVILNSLQLKLLNWGRAGLWVATFLLCFNSVTLAAQEKPKPEEFKVNPLEITKPDPLLPRLPKRGTLSPEEQSRLQASIDELDAQAAALYQEKKADEAFEVWYRGLRLRRALGRVEEVQALGRVGEIAWQNTRKFDTQVITRRLQEIQKEAEDQKALNLELLRTLGQAYQQVRFPEPAVKVYQQILAQERQQGDIQAQETTLKTLAQLNMDWFNYPQAAAIYEELLTQAQSRGDRVNELAYLEQLVYIYNKAQQPENALQMKQKLAATYPPHRSACTCFENCDRN
jgi:tetratricopeptide (TPR) repeat protein